MNGGLLSGWLESIFVTVNKSFLKTVVLWFQDTECDTQCLPHCVIVCRSGFSFWCVCPRAPLLTPQPFPVVCVSTQRVCLHMCVHACVCVCTCVCLQCSTSHPSAFPLSVCVHMCVSAHVCVCVCLHMLHFSPFRVFCSFTVSFSFTLCHSFPSRILQRQQNPPLTGLLSADQMSSEQRLGPDMFCRGAGQAWKAQRGNLEGERDVS